MSTDPGHEDGSPGGTPRGPDAGYGPGGNDNTAEYSWFEPPSPRKADPAEQPEPHTYGTGGGLPLPPPTPEAPAEERTAAWSYGEPAVAGGGGHIPTPDVPSADQPTGYMPTYVPPASGGDIGGGAPDYGGTAAYPAAADYTSAHDYTATPDYGTASAYTEPDPATPDPATPGSAMPGSAMPDYAAPDYTAPGYATPPDYGAAPDDASPRDFASPPGYSPPPDRPHPAAPHQPTAAGGDAPGEEVPAPSAEGPATPRRMARVRGAGRSVGGGAPPEGTVGGRGLTGRPAISLAAVFVLLLVGLGIGAGTGSSSPQAAGGVSAGVSARQVAVSGTTLICPPTPAGTQSTTITAFVPPAAGGVAASSAPSAAASPSGAPGGGNTAASISPVGAPGPALGTVAPPGTPAAYTSGATLPAESADAQGALAPGFTMEQTLLDTTGPARGLAGQYCEPPSTDFWFLAASADPSRQDHLFLVNSESVPATVNFDIYAPSGILQTPTSHGIVLAPGEGRDLLLSSYLAPPATAPTAAVHVWADSGRVSASLLDTSPPANRIGTDWIPATAAPAGDVVLPGIPADATNVHLVMLAPNSDAEVDLHQTATSTFVPAGHENVQLPAGQVADVDISDVVRGTPTSIALHSPDGLVVAGIKLSRAVAPGDPPDVGFLGSVPPLTGRAVVPDNQSGAGKYAQLILTAGDTAAQLTVTTAPTPSGPPPPGPPPTATQQITVPAGTTLAVPLNPPPGATAFAAVVTPGPGSGPVYGVRMQTDPLPDGPTFTIQPLLDDHETVLLPDTRNDPDTGMH